MNKIKISFDYDGTLSRHFGGEVNLKEQEIRNLFLNLINDDNVVLYIITRRYGPENPNKLIKNEYQAVFDTLNSLGVNIPMDNIIFTNRKYKYDYINRIGIDIHLDDDIMEYKLIDKFSKAKCVHVISDDWMEKFKLFFDNK